MSKREKPHINLVIIGHVDHGKSTTTGHFLFKVGSVDERTLRKLEEEARQLGREDFVFAFVLDRLKEERERGLTITPGIYEFETDKYHFTIIDAPGHRNFIKNMITGTSEADAAILVISAKPGEFEAGRSPEGQTREHLILARTLGINQFIILINKMDTVNYDQKRFEEIKNEVLRFARTLGLDLGKGIVAIIPVSGLKGDNLVEKSPNTPRYKGPTLYEALNMLKPPSIEELAKKPLRIPIQNVYNIRGVGVVPVGKVETGVLRVGDRVIINPPRETGEVKSIEMHHKPLEEARPGDNIGFNVKGVDRSRIGRGDVVGHPGPDEPTIAEEFTARIIVVRHPTAISAGYTPVLHVATAHAPVRFEAIEAKLDPRTGKPIEKEPAMIKQGDSAIVRLRPLKEIVVERFQDIRPLGRFAVRDMGKTVAVGIVLDVKAKNK